jgi:hypothetical protein
LDDEQNGVPVAQDAVLLFCSAKLPVWAVIFAPRNEVKLTKGKFL